MMVNASACGSVRRAGSLIICKLICFASGLAGFSGRLRLAHKASICLAAILAEQGVNSSSDAAAGELASNNMAPKIDKIMKRMTGLLIWLFRDAAFGSP